MDSPNQRYCRDYCKVQARKDKIRLRVQKHRKSKDIEELREKNRQYYYNYVKKWGKILKKYQHEDIGKAYKEHGDLMNQHFTGKGTNNFGPHRNPDFKKELELIKKEKKRRGLL